MDVSKNTIVPTKIPAIKIKKAPIGETTDEIFRYKRSPIVPDLKRAESEIKKIENPTAVCGSEMNNLSRRKRSPKSTKTMGKNRAIPPKRRTEKSFRKARVGPLLVKERRTKIPQSIKPKAKIE